MSSMHTVNVLKANFQEEVIDFSENTPVILLFQTDRLGICKQFYPNIEEAVNNANGAYRLAIIDTDRVSDVILKEYEVKHVPMVRFVYKGVNLGGFDGWKSKTDVSDYCQKVLEYIKENYQ